MTYQHIADEMDLSPFYGKFVAWNLSRTQILASGDHVIVRARVTGTHKGNFAGIAPTNKSVSWRSCNVVEVRNGKAIRSRIYSDNATLFEQLGVLSIPRAKAAG